MLFLRICDLFLLCVVSSGYGLSDRGNFCSVLAGCFVDKLVILYSCIYNNILIPVIVVDGVASGFYIC